MKTRSQVNKGLEHAEASAAVEQPRNVPVKKRIVDVRQRESKEQKMIQKPSRFDTNTSTVESHSAVSEKAGAVAFREERQQSTAERQSSVHSKREENSEDHSTPFDRNSPGQVAGISPFIDAEAFTGIAVGPGTFTSIHASPDSLHEIPHNLNTLSSPLLGTSKVSANRTSPIRAGSEQAPCSPFIPTGRMKCLSLNGTPSSSKSAAHIIPEPADMNFLPLITGMVGSGAQLTMQCASPQGLHLVGASLDPPRSSFGSHSSVLKSAIENQLTAHFPGAEAQLLVQHVAPDAQTAAVGPDKNAAEQPKEAKKTEKGKMFKRWTKEEDKKLKAAVNRVGGPPIDWVTVVESFDGERTARQCKTRWKNALSPHINHEPFTKREDNVIITCRKGGFGWPEIAQLLPRRTSEQIRDRFINYINPELKTTPWTKEEDDQLTEAQKRLGNKWTEISKILLGRSEKSIKNRWYNRKTMHSRKARRELIEKARNDKYPSIPSPFVVPSVSCDDEKSMTLSVKEEGNDEKVSPNQKSSAQASDDVNDEMHPYVIESSEV